MTVSPYHHHITHHTHTHTHTHTLLSLQVMTVIDRICLQNKVDLRLNVRLSPYGCVATGDETGMIEITRKSDTIARMQWAYGGAFDIKPIYSQIKSKCATPAALAKATDNFNRSCSGYVQTETSI